MLIAVDTIQNSGGDYTYQVQVTKNNEMTHYKEFKNKEEVDGYIDYLKLLNSFTLQEPLKIEKYDSPNIT